MQYFQKQLGREQEHNKKEGKIIDISQNHLKAT